MRYRFEWWVRDRYGNLKLDAIYHWQESMKLATPEFLEHQIAQPSRIGQKGFVYESANNSRNKNKKLVGILHEDGTYENLIPKVRAHLTPKQSSQLEGIILEALNKAFDNAIRNMTDLAEVKPISPTPKFSLDYINPPRQEYIPNSALVNAGLDLRPPRVVINIDKEENK